MFNFAQVTQWAVQAGAVIQCEQSLPQSILSALSVLLDTQARQAMQAKAAQFASAHTGATQAHLTLIEQHL